MPRNGTAITRDKFSGAEDFRFALSEGRVYGHTLVEKFGRHGDIQAAVEEDLFGAGQNFYYPTSASTISVVSDDAADDGGSPLGTGAWTVTVYGCDADYNEVSDTFTLAGTTPVSSSTSPLIKFFRVWRVKVGAVGSGGVNAGNIKVVDASSPENIIGYVTAGHGQSEQLQYTVPAGKTAHVYSGFFGVKEKEGAALAETSCIVHVWARNYNAASTNNLESWRLLESVDINNRGAGYARVGPISNIPQKSDIRVSAKVAANDTEVNGRLDIVLVDNAI